MPEQSSDPTAIGIDIGGTNTKIGVVTRSGQILESGSIPTDVQSRGLHHYLENLLSTVQRLVDAHPGQIAGIGGSLIGWTDEARTSPFLCLNAPLLHGVNIKGLLEENFHLPVSVTDDSSAHTLAEYHFGVGRGERRFLCLAMGTGLSAGVMIHRKLLNYTGGCAGDTGHVILRPGGPRCSAGCCGCGEALIGVEGIERLALEKTGQPLSARQVIEQARDGRDPQAAAVMAEIGGYVGELLASLSHIFLPEVIALSGGTANAGEVLLHAAQQRFEEVNGDYHRNYSAMAGDYYRGVRLVLGSMKGASGMVGSTVGLFFPEYLSP